MCVIRLSQIRVFYERRARLGFHVTDFDAVSPSKWRLHDRFSFARWCNFRERSHCVLNRFAQRNRVLVLFPYCITAFSGLRPSLWTACLFRLMSLSFVRERDITYAMKLSQRREETITEKSRSNLWEKNVLCCREISDNRNFDGEKSSFMIRSLIKIIEDINN